MKRRPVLAVVTAVVLLGLGAGISYELTDALGISAQPSDIPSEKPTVAAAVATVVPPKFTTIAAPPSERMTVALAELQDATSNGSGAETLVVLIDGNPATADDETYTLSGTGAVLTLTSTTETGAVRGVYDLALAARNGRAFTMGTVTSKLPFRMVDLGAVGVTADPSEWVAGDDYSHNSKAFEDVILPDAPYIDQAAMANATTDFKTFVKHELAEGYNAVAIPGFLEYLTFNGLGVYAADDIHVARAKAMQQAFGPLWKWAHDMGMKVYFRTDMLSLSTPLEKYLTGKFQLDTENPALWDVYSKGLDELYATMPYIDGTVIRIGEAGRVYDLPGWDYYSELAVTTVASVQAMLTSFTAEGDRSNKDVIFRSWSVGVGAVGDMHTNPDSYNAVLAGIHSPHLVVSTKYTLGDFYSHLPLNNTLEIGDQRRIIEFQSRREFENYGSFPNDLGPLYQEAIQTFIAANPHIEGIWAWTQDGGPWRAGPMTLTLKAGFWQLYELNTVLAVRLARDPTTDVASVTADWARRWFSDDPATVTAITQAMALSRSAITDGLYIGPYADQKVAAIGLHPPPMMWIFEWDILTGDSAVLDVLYNVSSSQLDEAIAEGPRAVSTVASMTDLLAATDAASWKSPELRQSFLDTLDYESNSFTMLSAYREMVLRQAQWHDSGSSTAYDAWAAARNAFEAAAADHESKYLGNVNYPAYNLTAARLGIARADADLPMAWAARVLFGLVVLWLVYGVAASNKRVRRMPGAPVARAMWVSATRPWRAVEVTSELTRLERWLLVAIPGVVLVLSRGILTWFEAPAHMLLMLAAWLVFALVVALVPRRVPVWPVIATIGGAALLRTILLLAVLTPTGPGGYWFHFWTDPLGRSVYVTLAFALFIWVLVAAGWTLATQIGSRRAVGTVLGAVGLVLAAAGAFIGLVGLEQALTVWNDQMGLLPWGLARILGITVYLGIPASSAWYAAIFGVVLLVVGIALSGLSSRSRRIETSRTST